MQLELHATGLQQMARRRVGDLDVSVLPVVLELGVRIIPLDRALARESALRGLAARERTGVERLPVRVPEPRLAAFPDRAGDCRAERSAGSMHRTNGSKDQASERQFPCAHLQAYLRAARRPRKLATLKASSQAQK